MYSICAECGSQVLDLALHMKIHNDKRSFECEVCGKVSFGKKRFLNHHQTHKSGCAPTQFKNNAHEKMCKGRTKSMVEKTLRSS